MTHGSALDDLVARLDSPSTVTAGGEVTPGGLVEPVAPAPGSAEAPARPVDQDGQPMPDLAGGWQMAATALASLAGLAGEGVIVHIEAYPSGVAVTTWAPDPATGEAIAAALGIDEEDRLIGRRWSGRRYGVPWTVVHNP